ncbi:MAG: CotH kinase family protein [Oscillospiraceae bacterium]|nr:CotH kinase family protein [Oscillospiraceae bacterium]
MSVNKNIDKICALITAITVIIAIAFCSGIGIESAARVIGYENRIFDKSKVHTIDIVMNNWDEFIASCENEEYTSCTAVIDGEAVSSVGLRAKGNTSLRNVSSMGSSRYSFKLEFDHYDSTKTYHGLDKLCLNNIIQDNTYMKDYLAYTLMENFGVASPLCSYAYITVNGEDWGLYLAVEAVEDSFSERNYNGAGELYKPDSTDMGGGQGNGRNFKMTDFMEQNLGGETPDISRYFDRQSNENSANGNNSERSKGNRQWKPDSMGGNMGGGMGSSDVKLQYTDDDPDSYPNIFNNAKTDITKADKARLIASLKALSEQSDIENAVDIDKVIRYFAVHNFLCNGDSYTGSMIHNYYLHEQDGILSMIPWDYNLAFGAFSIFSGSASGSVNMPIDSPVSGDISDRPMISWIFGNDEYTAQYHALLAEFVTTDFEALITKTSDLISEYVEKDPTKFCTYEEFEKGVSAIKTFCTLRTQSIEGQLSGIIPSTSDGQNADIMALVDTSSLTLSDMGSMGDGMGGNRGGNRRNANDSSNMQSFNGAMPQMPGGLSPDENDGDPAPKNFSDSNFPPDSAPENFSELAPPDNFTSPDSAHGGDFPGFDSDNSDNRENFPTLPNSETTAVTEEPTAPSSSENPPTAGTRPAMGEPPTQPTESVSNQMPLLIISAAVLVIGIVFAALFKE